MFLESGKPVGDGVVWLQRYKEYPLLIFDKLYIFLRSNDHFDNSSDFESVFIQIIINFHFSKVQKKYHSGK